MIEELIFVYNADSGKWNGYIDIMHKVFSPKTYPCSLCAITHGTFSIKEDWDSYIKELPVQLTFLHKDEWKEVSDLSETLPAIFSKTGNQISTWITADKLNQMDLDQLKNTISSKLKKAAFNTPH